MLTLQLLSLSERPLGPVDAISQISDYTPRFVEFMEKLAVSYNINIIGGTHPSQMANGEILNVCHVFLRDGSVHTQQKLHHPVRAPLVEHSGRSWKLRDPDRLWPDRRDDLL